MAAEESSDTNKSFQDASYLIPELLESSKLIEILQERGVNIKRNMYTLNKDDLVVLFRKYVSSLPQRIWKENRRGRKMNKFISQKDDNFVTVSHSEEKPKPVNFNRRSIKVNNNDKYGQKRKAVSTTVNYNEPNKKSRTISWP